MKLSLKMLIAFLIVGLTPMLTLEILFLSNSQKAISKEVISHLESLRMEAYFFTVLDSVVSIEQPGWKIV